MSDSQTSFIRMIWDYYGTESEPTATHFLRHLKDFLSEHNVPFTALEVEAVSNHHAAAYVDLGHVHLELVGRALKPHRVYKVSNNGSD